MTKVITVNNKGALTLPSEVREMLGVKRGGQLVVEVEEGGEVVLRPGIVMPLEMYSAAQIEAFQKLNEAPLAGKRLRWVKPGRTAKAR